jgi:hypothetical protein
MKKLEELNFNYTLCKQQVEEFRTLLASGNDLSEQADVLPFFRAREHMAALFGMFNPRIGWVDRIAWEFDIFGDFACDLVVGDWTKGAYCFVEFEDAVANSVFERQGKKATREWSRRFDHGYSQIIDWFHKLDDRSPSADLVARFGNFAINYEAVLVIGRDQHLDAGEKLRMEWRSSNVVVHSKKVHCVTFDQLLSQLSARLGALALVEKSAQDPAKAVEPAKVDNALPGTPPDPSRQGS